MRVALAAALAAAAIGAYPAAQARQDASPTQTLERPFVTNGRIEMDLSAGDYRISGTDEPRIKVGWIARHTSALRWIDAHADVKGAEARLTVDVPHNSGVQVAIDVPTRADLYVRLTAGELRIRGVQGNKDVGLHAGELDIDVGNPMDYGRVEASVWAGELHAQPFGGHTEGLFRSFDWTGKGPYRLNVHLKAGEVHLRAN